MVIYCCVICNNSYLVLFLQFEAIDKKHNSFPISIENYETNIIIDNCINAFFCVCGTFGREGLVV